MSLGVREGILLENKWSLFFFFFLKLTKVGHLKLIDECLNYPYNKQLSCEGIIFTLLFAFFEMEVVGTHILVAFDVERMHS